jgi:hypothetical protein
MALRAGRRFRTKARKHQLKDRYHRWLERKRIERCLKNLKRNGFDAHLAPSAQAASRQVLSLVSDDETFGIGGSESVRTIGVVEELRIMGKTLYDHWQSDLSADELHALRLQQGRCDCFLCSANAISEEGEIVNVDGIGNRVAAMIFGPRKVVLVAGANKITPDLPTALKRVREVAAPMRAKSLGMETPCAESGRCADCRAPQRICRVTAILHRPPMLTDITVVLVAQALGF